MKITWLGHSGFRIESGDSVILIDPFITGNGIYKGTLDEAMRGCTHVVLTHGHDDHVGDTVAICKATGAKLIAVYELALWLNSQGVEGIEPGNPGGTIRLSGFEVSFTKAFHSSSTMVDGRHLYLGTPCGIVLHAGGKTIYHMGDTEIFGDMALVQQMYKPQIGFVPVGDRFTMGGKQAALACKTFFTFDLIVPIHYGTFPIIEPDPSKFLAEMSGYNVLVPQPGAAFEV